VHRLHQRPLLALRLFLDLRQLRALLGGEIRNTEVAVAVTAPSHHPRARTVPHHAWSHAGSPAAHHAWPRAPSPAAPHAAPWPIAPTVTRAGAVTFLHHPGSRPVGLRRHGSGEQKACGRRNDCALHDRPPIVTVRSKANAAQYLRYPVMYA